MIKSDSISELAKALCIVQGKLEGSKKDSVNPFYKSRYSTLSSVWDACRQLLTENGLAVVQTNSPSSENTTTVDTTLLHNSGEWIGGSMTVPLSKNDPQGVGSAITYSRRYGLSAILGISPEDDDAEGATIRKDPAKVVKEPSASKSDIKKMFDTAMQYGWDNDHILALMVTKFQIAETKLLTSDQCEELSQAIKDKTEKGG